ncbi:hypothetical protein PWT90_08091 [Aphanocladium album]|nr:hypothetical protein PWT90_08091 [Aphanocladium album]
MVVLATGVWWDYSKSSASAATLTLPITSSNLLLSAIASLVTIAGVSAWNITAFVLHAMKVRQAAGSPAQAIDLMHRVTLRNSRGSTSTIWEAIKIYKSWSSSRGDGTEKGHQSHPFKLLSKTCMVAIPAMVVWVGFTVAAVFSSSVANSKTYGTTVARLKAQNCGIWNYNFTSHEGNVALLTKQVNDTIQARNYVTNFYANTSTSSPARSLYVKQSLLYTVNSSAPCPIPDSKRCREGPNGAFEMRSAPLDSHSMLGINAKAEDRVALQLKTTCSPVGLGGFTDVTEVKNATFLDFGVGLVKIGGNQTTNVTYRHNVDSGRTGMGYMISTRSAYGNDRSKISVWLPIPELSQTNADMSIYFLSQNALFYLDPVYDKWFSANGTYSMPLDDGNVTSADYLVNTLVCAEQYSLCNPTTSQCTPFGGWLDLHENMGDINWMGFNHAQAITARRFIMALIDATAFNVVGRLGVGSLTLFGFPAAFQHQCNNQLVVTAGEVQNFSLVGLLLVVCLSVFVILLDWSLESIVDFIGRRRGWDSLSKRARQAVSKLHLLRMALEGKRKKEDVSDWRCGSMGIPVQEGAEVFGRLAVVGDLVSYAIDEDEVVVVAAALTIPECVPGRLEMASHAVEFAFLLDEICDKSTTTTSMAT